MKIFLGSLWLLGASTTCATTAFPAPAGWPVARSTPDKPSYILFTTDDKSVPALQQCRCKRSGAKTSRAKSSHLVYGSHWQVVAALIEEAAYRVK